MYNKQTQQQETKPARKAPSQLGCKFHRSFAATFCLQHPLLAAVFAERCGWANWLLLLLLLLLVGATRISIQHARRICITTGRLWLLSLLLQPLPVWLLLCWPAL
jgi:hypothetical protein